MEPSAWSAMREQTMGNGGIACFNTHLLPLMTTRAGERARSMIRREQLPHRWCPFRDAGVPAMTGPPRWSRSGKRGAGADGLSSEGVWWVREWATRTVVCEALLATSTVSSPSRRTRSSVRSTTIDHNPCTPSSSSTVISLRAVIPG